MELLRRRIGGILELIVDVNDDGDARLVCQNRTEGVHSPWIPKDELAQALYELVRATKRRRP